MDRSPLPSADSVVNKLLTKEIRLQFYFEKGILCASNHYVLLVPSKPFCNQRNKGWLRVQFL